MPKRKLRIAEIDDFDCVLLGENNIARLDIAMHHSSGVSGNQAASGLNRNINRVAQRKRATRDFAGESFALIKGRHDVGAAVWGLLNSVDHTDVGMIQ